MLILDVAQAGRQRTAAMNEQLQQAEKGDILDFKLDGGMATQEFDGVDYSSKEKRDAIGGPIIPFAAITNDLGQRERKAHVAAAWLPNEDAKGPGCAEAKFS